MCKKVIYLVILCFTYGVSSSINNDTTPTRSTPTKTDKKDEVADESKTGGSSSSLTCVAAFITLI